MIEFLKSDTFRRAVAAVVGAALPVVNGFVSQKFGITIPAEATVSAVVLLAGYIAQSAVNAMHARANPVTTVSDAAAVLSKP